MFNKFYLSMIFIVCACFTLSGIDHHPSASLIIKKPETTPSSVLKGSSAREIPGWMMAQITSDLALFQSTDISASSLDEVMEKFSESDGLFRYKIVNGQVSMESKNSNSVLTSRALKLQKAFSRLASTMPLPDVDFICCTHDDSYLSLEVPLFVFAKKKHAIAQALIPDFEAFFGYVSDPDQFFKKSENKFPWETKEDKGFWRGSTTGGDFSSSNWKNLPRSQLVLLSIANPRYLNARFTQLCQGAQHNHEMLGMANLVGGTASPLDSLKYKYQIDVDGNTCGYSRCYWILLSNSVSLKQVSDNIQWYYGALVPYVHYIPVANDMSNVINKIQWAQKHDEKAQKIAKNATEFVLNNLREEHIYLYMYLLLTKYAELQR